MIRYVFKFCSWRGSIKRWRWFINRLLKSKNCCKKRVDKFEQKWRRYLHRTVCIYLLSSNKPFFMHLPTYDACLSAFMSECCQIGSSDWMSCHFSSNKAKIKMSQQIMVLKRFQVKSLFNHSFSLPLYAPVFYLSLYLFIPMFRTNLQNKDDPRDQESVGYTHAYRERIIEIASIWPSRLLISLRSLWERRRAYLTSLKSRNSKPIKSGGQQLRSFAVQEWNSL